MPAARACWRTQSRSSIWAAIERGDLRLCQPGRRGQPQRGPDGRCCWPGYPVEVPAATINRLCGSGMDAVGTIGPRDRAPARSDLMASAGGVESMTRAPFVMPKADSAFSARQRHLRHHHRLALRQSEAHEGAVRHRQRCPRPPRTSPPTTASRTRGAGRHGAAPARCAPRPRQQKSGFFDREIVPVSDPVRRRASATLVDEGRASARDHAWTCSPS